MSGACGKGPGEPPPRAWTRDLAPRDPQYLVRLSSLDPDCPCTFPAAGQRTRSRPIALLPFLCTKSVSRIPTCDGYQHSLTVPYLTTLSAHHLIAPPHPYPFLYNHPLASPLDTFILRPHRPGAPKAELGPPSPFQPDRARPGVTLGSEEPRRAVEPSSHRPGEPSLLAPHLSIQISTEPPAQILPPESLLYHTRTLRQQYHQALPPSRPYRLFTIQHSTSPPQWTCPIWLPYP